MRRVLVVLALMVTSSSSVFGAPYVGPAPSCSGGWCLGTNGGSCYDDCYFNNVSLTCDPTTSSYKTWTCQDNIAPLCQAYNVIGCGPSVTCDRWSDICGNCGMQYRLCGTGGAGCYATFDHVNCGTGTKRAPSDCTSCAPRPNSYTLNCCGNGPSATPTRTPTPTTGGGGGGPSPTPGGGGSSPTPTRTPTPAPDVPTGLSATCLSATQVRLSWNAVAGADGYSVRADAATSSWTFPASCAPGPENGTGPGDFCRTFYGATNYTFNVTAGVTYGWWMHARRSGDPAYWSGVAA